MFVKEMSIGNILHINRANLTFDKYVHYNGLTFLPENHIKSMLDLVLAQIPLTAELINRLISPKEELGFINIVSTKNVKLSLVLHRDYQQSFYDVSNFKNNESIKLTSNYKDLIEHYIKHLSECK